MVTRIGLQLCSPIHKKTVMHCVIFLSEPTLTSSFFFFFKAMLSNYTEYSSFVEIDSSKMDHDHLIKRKTELYTTDKISHFSCTINCNEYLSVLMHNTASFHVLNIYVSSFPFFGTSQQCENGKFLLCDITSCLILGILMCLHILWKKNPFYFMVSLHQRYPDCDYKSNFTSCV